VRGEKKERGRTERKKRSEMATNDKKDERKETVNCDSLSMSYCPAL